MVATSVLKSHYVRSFRDAASQFRTAKPGELSFGGRLGIRIEGSVLSNGLIGHCGELLIEAARKQLIQGSHQALLDLVDHHTAEQVPGSWQQYLQFQTG